MRKARQLFAEKGLSNTEMEDIRLACEVSRGGLYHHFSSKRAILDALVEEEVQDLAAALVDKDRSPFQALLEAGSSHLGKDPGGNNPGVLASLSTQAEKLDYLSALDNAFTTILRDALSERLAEFVSPDVNGGHVAELFLSINAHINHREILGHWSSSEAADFAATALKAVAPLLKSSAGLTPIIAALAKKAATS